MLGSENKGDLQCITTRSPRYPSATRTSSRWAVNPAPSPEENQCTTGISLRDGREDDTVQSAALTHANRGGGEYAAADLEGGEQ